MQKINIASDVKLQTIIRSLIMTEWVSVNFDPSGQIKEYHITATNGTALDLEICPMNSDDKNHYFAYTIYLNDTEVANAIIPQERTIHSPIEDIILGFFQMCSDKIIWQETKTRLQNTLGGMAQKIYSC